MGLFSPWLLLLGLAAAVPVLLHLMHRRPGPRLEFPALRYLRRAERESGRRVRLRQLLLLALRITAVVLLAVAAARPFLRAGASAHPPTDVVIVLDNSMSTGAVVDGRRVFDMLRDAARASLAAAGPDDRFWLVRAAEPWEPAAPGDAPRLAAGLERAGPVDAPADLRAAIRRAASLLAAASSDRPREIHLLTDLQATGFASDGDGVPALDDAAILVFTPAVPAPDNHGVGPIEVAGGLAPRSGEAASLSVQVVGSRTDSLTLRLWIEDRPVAAALASPGHAAVFALPPRAEGLVTGRIEAEPDALRADDRREFAYRVVPPVAVASTTTAPFVAEALAALAGAGRIRRVAPAQAEVMVADAAAIVSARAGPDALVLLPPDSAVRLPAANAALARLGVGWRLEPDAASGTASIVGTDAGAQGPLDDVRVARAYRLVPADRGAPTAATDTLLRLSDGRPWLLAAPAAAGQRVLVLASPLGLDASNIPASAAMIPLLDRMTGEWAGAAAGALASFRPGTVVDLPGRAAALIDPADSLRPVEGGAPFRLPARAGVYRVLASPDPAGEVLAAYEVAPAAAESRLERLPVARIEDALGPDATIVSERAAWSDRVFVERTGGEFWRVLLLAAILALLLESVLAATRRPAGATIASRPAAGQTAHAARTD